MEDTAAQLRIVELARKHGLDPANLSGAEHRRLAFLAHDKKARAAVAATASLARTRLLKLVVLRSVEAANERECAACPRQRFLADGTEVCDACTCSGALLESKRKDPKQKCPGVREGAAPRWDNRDKPTRRNPDAEIEERGDYSRAV